MEEPNSEVQTERVARSQRYFGLLNRYKFIVIGLIIIGSTLLWGPTIYANLSTRSIRYNLERTSVQNVPKKPVAIVFGAGLYDGDKPTPYLRWRVETAVQLYEAGRVEKLLMTGDNSTKNHNEPVAMQKLAESLGVPAKNIVLDYAGFNTYDSCYRAQAIFKVTSATLVSQGYHLPRAVMACNSLGIKTIGVDAVHDQGQSYKVQYIVREWFSTDKIVLQLLFKPKPTLLGPTEAIKF